MNASAKGKQFEQSPEVSREELETAKKNFIDQMKPKTTILQKIKTGGKWLLGIALAVAAGYIGYKYLKGPVRDKIREYMHTKAAGEGMAEQRKHISRDDTKLVPELKDTPAEKANPPSTTPKSEKPKSSGSFIQPVEERPDN